MNPAKFLRFFLLMMFVGNLAAFESAAQIIDEKEVVPAVMDLFNRKFRKSTEPVWEMKGNDYAVNFLMKGKKTYAEFDRTGRLVLQRTEMLLEELRPNTQEHLRKKFKSQTIKKAEYVQEFPSKKYYYVEMVPKRMKDEEDAPVTKVYFNNTGQFDRVGDEKEEAEAQKPDLEIPAAVMKEFNKRAKKSTDVDWMDVDTAYRASYKSGTNEVVMIIDYDGVWKITATRMKAKYKSLHPGIQRYISENIDGFTFQYAEDILTPTEKYFNVVILDKSDEPPAGGELLPTQLHFTKSGKHIATFFPDYDVDEVKVKTDKKWDKASTGDKLAAAGGDYTEIDIERKDLPSKAQEYLTKQYNHEWRTRVCRAIEDDVHGMLYYVVMKKQGADISHEHYFDLHGNLIEEAEE